MIVKASGSFLSFNDATKNSTIEWRPRNNANAVSFSSGANLELDFSLKKGILRLLGDQTEGIASGSGLVGLGDVPSSEVE